MTMFKSYLKLAKKKESPVQYKIEYLASLQAMEVKETINKRNNRKYL